jgi:hypothetical protein
LSNTHPPISVEELHQFDSAEIVEVGSIFRVGNPSEIADVTVDGTERHLVWFAGPHDIALAGIANWRQYLRSDSRYSQHGLEVLRIPADTRPASSILSGVEAWEGEKSELLDWAASYVKNVGRIFPGSLDVGLSLSGIARSKDGSVFIVPPHKIKSDPESQNEWKHRIISELNNALTTGESPQQAHRLIQDFLIAAGVYSREEVV